MEVPHENLGRTKKGPPPGVPGPALVDNRGVTHDSRPRLLPDPLAAPAGLHEVPVPRSPALVLDAHALLAGRLVPDGGLVLVLDGDALAGRLAGRLVLGGDRVLVLDAHGLLADRLALRVVRVL